MAQALKLGDLLADLASSGCEFVVIGSSALALQGWDVTPTDLDLMTDAEGIECIKRRLDIGDESMQWVRDGEAERLECQTSWGPVDLYLEVSGDLTYGAVVRDSVAVAVGETDRRARVGSFAHVRDMRAAVGRDSVPSDAVAPAVRKGAPNVIAIDGPAGAGKSTVTRAVAKKIGSTYLDTGAMYRCVALTVLEERADTDNSVRIAEIANGIEIRFTGEKVLLNGHDVTDAIRTGDVTRVTSHIAAYPEVRAAMVRRQRQLFEEAGFVAEGRDTGTVVAPDAPLKVYLTASPEERARRRAKETGQPTAIVLREIEERDRLDSARKLSALKVAEDAIVVDTTGRSIQDVVDEIVAFAHERKIV